MNICRIIAVALCIVFLTVLPARAGAIHQAARKGEIKKVEAFLKDNPELINVQDAQEGRTPLHWAASGGSADMAAFLLARGAQVHAKDRDGQMPIHLAANIATAEALLKAGANLTARDDYGRVPLHYAAYYGNDRMVQFYLDRGISINIQDNEGNTPLLMALSNGRRSTAVLLIDRGAQVNLQNREAQSPLKAAKKKGYRDIVDMLMKRNAVE